MDIIEATRSYESWMARHIPLIRNDLRHKHTLMAESPFIFLRGTFYRWAQVWPEVCAKLADAPRVLAVGDLHVDNFGTWRDHEGRLVWGVNDLDEATVLPYTNDLVRLATSAVLAAGESQIALSTRTICASILEGYLAAFERGGRPFVLAERYSWLRAIAVHQLTNPKAFWARLARWPRVSSPPEVLIPLMSLPAGAIDVRFLRRTAGVGSLGRRRIVALATHDGGVVGREAKAVLPSAAIWATNGSKALTDIARLNRRSVRAPDPFFRVTRDWTVRRMSPDCVKIALRDLPRRRDDSKLLRAMGWETANLHLGTSSADTRADVARRPADWLLRASMSMVDAVKADHRAWKAHRRRTSLG
jgi:hypothetical protein